MKIENKNSSMHVSQIRLLDEPNTHSLRHAVISALPERPESIEFNLAEVTTVDCVGLSILDDIRKDVLKRKPDVKIQLVDPTPAVRQLLMLTGLDQDLEIESRNMRKNAVLPLFVFIDACGWEILKNNNFAEELTPHRRKLRSVFGYSSACIPSILSGRWPSDHRNWCYFVRDPDHSPFRPLRVLRWLPHAITSRRIFRRWLSKFLRGPLKFRGYFDLYNIPFRHISLFDFTEKKNPLEPGGLNKGPNIFDYLEEGQIPYHVSEPTKSETDNLQSLIRDISAGWIDFGFLYWPALDGLMHESGNQSPLISEKLKQYEIWLQELMSAAGEHYDEVKLYVFSDHGMANCDSLLDLREQINQLPLEMPQDYTVVYDSTMARFWFANEESRRLITDCLNGIDQGRILEDEELKSLGTYFPDGYFGELIFLADEGVLIIPSDMGERPLQGMHGYHPDAPQSYASLLSNVEDIPENITDIPHIYQLMTKYAQLAHDANNQKVREPVTINN